LRPGSSCSRPKELTRRSDELARQRQQLPSVRIDEDYRFDTDEGNASLADLFRERSQLLVYHFMFGPEYTAGCPACSTIADCYSGLVVHLENHDVAMTAVSRAPIADIQAYKGRMEWSFPWASSLGSEFNFDFNVSFTEEQQREGTVEYNFRSMDVKPVLEAGDGPLAEIAAMVETDPATIHAGGARDERVRARGRCRLPHLLRVSAGRGRPLGDVPVARSGTEGAQRDRAVVSTP
jgi:predicted dithiol-disulfide oxidoreductase (DUF899 family)